MLTVTDPTPDRPGPERPALVAELWYEAAPNLEDPGLLAALREVSADTEAQGSAVTVPHQIGAGSGVAPLLTVLLPGSSLDDPAKSLPDTSQTWSWVGAEQAVQGCRASLLVSEMFAAGADPAERVAALTTVLDAVIRTTGPAVISWPQSQRVADPAEFEAEDLDGIINVRLFTVARDPGALVMDTLGLNVFGMPDVQCHFRDRDPGEIAALLYTTAVYLFDSGDVILDGNTISEPNGQGRYVCRREPALLDPARPVLDVDLGDPYAAGDRDRTV